MFANGLNEMQKFLTLAMKIEQAKKKEAIKTRNLSPTIHTQHRQTKIPHLNKRQGTKSLKT